MRFALFEFMMMIYHDLSLSFLAILHNLTETDNPDNDRVGEGQDYQSRELGDILRIFFLLCLRFLGLGKFSYPNQTLNE